MVVGLCLVFCKKGLGVTFEEVENLLLDILVVYCLRQLFDTSPFWSKHCIVSLLKRLPRTS